MWNCPNCHRPQSYKHVVFGEGLIRKEWRCGNCNALLRTSAVAATILGLVAALSVVVLFGWIASDVVRLSPYGFVALAVFALLGACFRRITLVETDHTVCRHCRYDLHGNTTGVCPECGTPIEDEKS